MFPVSDASEPFLPVFVWVCSMSYKLKDIYIGLVLSVIVSLGACWDRPQTVTEISN